MTRSIVEQGFAALEQGDLAAAAQAAQDLLALGSAGEGWYLLGLVRWTEGDRASTVPCLEAAAAALPDRTDIAYNLGVLHRERGDDPAAAALWRRLVDRAPDLGDAWLGLAAVTETIEGAAASEAVFAEGLAALPGDAGLLYNGALLAFRQGQVERAAEHGRRLVDLHPDHAAGWLNLGMALKRLGRFAQAEACYRRAITLGDPACLARAEFNLSNLLLMQGIWEAGFAAYEARLRLPEAPQPGWALPAWTGSEPEGTRVLLWNDQGYGDAMLFLRDAGLVAARGHRVFLYADRPLQRLGATAPGIEAAFALDQDRPVTDVQIPLGSLPHATGLRAPIWPGPYLAGGADAARPDPAGDLRIGLVWGGNPAQINDANRSLTLGQLGPLLERSGIRWQSLQVGKRAAELEGSPWAGLVEDRSAGLTDFAQTAAALRDLDLLIAVDTAVAHLCGAMGRPGWIMLPHVEAYCFWGLEPERTVWYPSLRLFRQAAPGDWSATIGRLGRALDALAGRNVR